MRKPGILFTKFVLSDILGTVLYQEKGKNMPTRVEILFEQEIDTDRLNKLLQDHVIRERSVLDYSISLIDDSGETLPLSIVDVTRLSIYALPIKNRTARVLTEARMNNCHGVCVRRTDKDILTVGQLVGKNARELLKYFEFGTSALADVRDALAKFGLHLENEQKSLPL